MITCTRRLEWDAAHRITRHESKCATVHGHRYAAEITCRAPRLDGVGRVVDFGVVKEQVGAWIDEHWDHTTLLFKRDLDLLEFLRTEATCGKREPYTMDGEPTAENIAHELLRIASRLLQDKVEVVAVRIYETPNCWADARAD